MKHFFKIFFFVSIFFLIDRSFLPMDVGLDLNAQQITWQRVLNNNHGGFRKAQQIHDGGYIAVGTDKINNYDKILLVKFNNFGDTTWKRIIGTKQKEFYESYWIEETRNKGFIIAGATTANDSGNADALLVKTDSSGNVIWMRNYGGTGLDQAYCIKQTNDGGYILIIRSLSFSISQDLLVLKTDSMGNVMWQKIYNNSFGNQIMALSNFGYAIIGSKTVTNNEADVYLLKMDLNGDTLWSRTYGGKRTDQGLAIKETDDKGFIIGGTSNSFISGSSTESYVIKTDSVGNLQWQRTYSIHLINGFDGCNAILYKPGNGYVLVGISDSVWYNNIFASVRKIDLSGNLVYQRLFKAGNNNNDFRSGEITNDNGFILAGYTSFSSLSLKMYIVKTDSLGHSTPLGILQNTSKAPVEFKLYQNYPNPFNSRTNIDFAISKSTFINLSIFGVTGNLIKTLINEYKPNGSYSINFDASILASGTYFYKIERISNFGQTIKFSEVKKMIILK